MYINLSSIFIFPMLIYWNALRTPGRSIITKKGDGSQVKESTDSSTTIEDDDVKGRKVPLFYVCISLLFSLSLFLPSVSLSYDQKLRRVFLATIISAVLINRLIIIWQCEKQEYINRKIANLKLLLETDEPTFVSNKWMKSSHVEIFGNIYTQIRRIIFYIITLTFPNFGCRNEHLSRADAFGVKIRVFENSDWIIIINIVAAVAELSPREMII